MKNLKYVLFILLIVISFYIADKIIIYMENKHPIMQEIDARLGFFQEAYVNAIIDDNTIIPGINGRNVNRRRSYARMGEFGLFNETFIVFNAVRPRISLQDNKDKVIVRGNPARRQVSLILEPNDNIINHLVEQNIAFTIIANLSIEIKREYEYIAAEIARDKMSDLALILNRRRVNSNICLVDRSNIEFCHEKSYFIVAPSIDTRRNINEILTSIRSGEIILVRENITLPHLNLILSEIRRQDLEVVLLSTLISENV